METRLKELRNHYSVPPTSKTLNALKKINNFSWILKRDEDTRQATIPKFGETSKYRELGLPEAESDKQKPSRESVLV